MKVLIKQDCSLDHILGYSNVSFKKGITIKLTYDLAFYLIRKGWAKEVR